MTSVQEEVRALAVAQIWSEWSQLHAGDNEVDRDDSGAVESLTISLKQNKTMELVNEQNEWLQQEVADLKESYQDLEAEFNAASALLDMDEQKLTGPLRRAGEWTRNKAKNIENNKAWTKKATIHVLVMAQKEKKLESFFEKPETVEEHQTKKLLEDIIDLAGKYL
ncbi:hypothetical protein V6N12_035941 [Hibiscus sabdariffa]|uniref:Uncharacterized protein n=1 Tax=Hibiscus sabdariffa TaxID=183260 RepID=A0ABR2EP74_9ROSI